MAAIDLAREYIQHVNGRHGERAAALFAEDGEVIAATGRRYRGRAEIARFVDAEPEATTAQIGPRHMSEHQVVLHGVVQTPHLAPAEVDWLFEVEGNLIKRLTIQVPEAEQREG